MNDKSDDHRGPRRPGGRPAGKGPRKQSRPEAGDRPAMRKARPGQGEGKRAVAPRRPAKAAAAREVLPDRDGRQRIAKIMARAGVASRRDAEDIIRAGRVSVNGKVIDTPATLIGPEDRVTIDGAPMPTRERTRLWLYHKERGLVTTARDPEGRPTVFDMLPAELPRVVAIGRLDINTEGLLLLTNDGGLARVLAHPETGWLRRYRVRAYGETDQAALDGLADGVTIDGMHYGPVEARLERQQGDNVWLTLGLREGKNREVKRILEHLGLRVNRLIRVSFGPFQLGDLGEGAVEEVRTRVLKDQLGEALAAEAGVDFEAPVFAPDTDIVERPQRPAGRPRPSRDAHAPLPAEPARRNETKGRSVWRAGEEEGGGRARPPRRGADPKAERVASAAKEHTRAGRIADAKGRKVLVERIVGQAGAPEDEAPAPRRRSAGRGEFRPREDFEKRGFDKRDAGERRGGRFAEERPGRRDFGGAPSGRPARGRPGADQPPDRAGGRPFGKPAGGRGLGGKGSAERSSDGRSPDGRSGGGKSFAGKSFAGKSFGGKSFGGKSFGGKPFGGKSASGKPSANRSSPGNTSPGKSRDGRPGRAPGGPRKPPSGPRKA